MPCPALKGFPEPVVRKALVLHRNRVPEAVEWLLIHSEDADAGEPVTQEQLRRVSLFDKHHRHSNSPYMPPCLTSSRAALLCLRRCRSMGRRRQGRQQLH